MTDFSLKILVLRKNNKGANNDTCLFFKIKGRGWKHTLFCNVSFLSLSWNNLFEKEYF